MRILEILQNVTLSDIPADVKGTVYEELIRNTFEKSDNQQFFTPHPVVEFMVRFINPQPDQTICDPACGSGGFLIEASKHINKVLRKRTQENLSVDSLTQYLSNHIIGLEIDKRMAWVAQMNLIMHSNGHGNVKHLGDGGSLAFSNQLDVLCRPK